MRVVSELYNWSRGEQESERFLEDPGEIWNRDASELIRQTRNGKAIFSPSVIAPVSAQLWLSNVSFLTCTKGKLFPPPEGINQRDELQTPGRCHGAFSAIPRCREQSRRGIRTDQVHDRALTISMNQIILGINAPSLTYVRAREILWRRLSLEKYKGSRSGSNMQLIRFDPVKLTRI